MVNSFANMIAVALFLALIPVITTWPSLPSCQGDQLLLIARLVTETELDVGRCLGDRVISYGVFTPTSIPCHIETLEPKDLIPLQYHCVCWDKQAPTRLHQIDAVIGWHDMIYKAGQRTTEASMKMVQDRQAICGSDEAGHIVPQSWGGHGLDFNIFPQNANVGFVAKILMYVFQLNRGEWNKICNQIAKWVNNTLLASVEDRRVRMRITFTYDQAELRPKAYYFLFTMFTQMGVVSRVGGYLTNESQKGTTVTECFQDDMQLTLRQVTIDGTEEYNRKRSCRPSQGPFDTPYDEL